MQYTLLLLTLFGLASASATPLIERAPVDPGTGAVYAYECGNCKCNAVASNTGISGASGCFTNNWGGSLRALGLTGKSGNPKTTCSLFTSSDCSGGVVCREEGSQNFE